VLNAMNQAQQVQQGGAQQQNGSQRRGYGQDGQEQGGESYQDEQPGLGDQPSGQGEGREIPIAAAAPE
jgi:hypothetical protein